MRGPGTSAPPGDTNGEDFPTSPILSSPLRQSPTRGYLTESHLNEAGSTTFRVRQPELTLSSNTEKAWNIYLVFLGFSSSSVK